ncbi:unnamed protein product [Gongylonema pulchrum]|uniref:Cyclic nucleotide-binding domain-containing protein n=1 Tax=Gongylonema pulchrum TaxID=637853 RepID=A0A183EBG2_9BILA|nr:unnamed protein product [Gongylonema pulchrum]
MMMKNCIIFVVDDGEQRVCCMKNAELLDFGMDFNQGGALGGYLGSFVMRSGIERRRYSGTDIFNVILTRYILAMYPRHYLSMLPSNATCRLRRYVFTLSSR